MYLTPLFSPVDGRATPEEKMGTACHAPTKTEDGGEKYFIFPVDAVRCWVYIL
jgi:hypothetical protein